MRIAPSLVAFGVAVGVAVALGACGKIDNKDAEKKIKEWASSNIGPVSKVKCPEAKMKAGNSFECKVTFEGGGDYALKVDQKDDKGNVEWSWVVQPIGAEKAAEMIKEDLVKNVPDVTVDCGKGVVTLPPEGIRCKAAGDGEQVTFLFKLEGENLTWTPVE